MAKIRSGARASVPNGLVCIGLHGQTGDPVQPDVLALMRELDDVGASYRLFSLDTPESGLYNAVLNQLPVFLMSVGGTAYEVDLHLPGAAADCYFLGIDIGHNPEAPESKPVSPSWTAGVVCFATGSSRSAGTRRSTAKPLTPASARRRRTSTPWRRRGAW